MSERLEKALRFAMKRHRGQWRDGESPLPYGTHPVDVLNILRYEGRELQEEVLCAALLHDLLEETETKIEEIEAKFGQAVAKLVSELTRKEPSAQVREALGEQELWELRNQMLLDEIAEMSLEAKTIKLADRVSNLRGGKATRTGEKLDRYLRQSKQILDRIPREVSPPLWDLVQALAEK